jgi:dolichyl-phosphate-mannose--protein O-mannosyl transferase
MAGAGDPGTRPVPLSLPPALSFAILALGFTIHWLWDTPVKYGRFAALAFLAVAGVTFLYFYPHWTAVDVPTWLDDSYYWFDSWR